MLKSWIRRKFLNWLDHQLEQTGTIRHLKYIRDSYGSRLYKLEQAEEERQAERQAQYKEKRIYGEHE